jgi:hypothetical protein
MKIETETKYAIMTIVGVPLAIMLFPAFFKLLLWGMYYLVHLIPSVPAISKW